MDNVLIKKLEEIRWALTEAKKPPTWLPADRLLQLTVPVEEFQQIRTRLDAAGIPMEAYEPQEINIKLAELAPNTTVYFEEKNFLQSFKNATPPAADVAIIDYRGSWLVYDHDSKQVQTGNGKTGDKPTAPYLIANSVAWLAAVPSFKSPALADYFNPTDKELVLYSANRGIKRILVPADIPAFDPEKDLEKGLTLFRQQLAARSARDFAKCFKDVLFGFIATAPEKELAEIVVALPGLITAAENDLQVYYKSFSFDKLKSELVKEKDKYFAALRDILGKNMAQIVGVPVSFAASVFTTYKTNDNFILGIVLLAYLAYTVFTYYLQSLNLKDIREIESDFTADFDNIAQRSGLPADTIQRERAKIERRIADIRRVIRYYRILLCSLAVVFIVFIIYQVTQNATAGNQGLDW
jgi:hypothetical protein